MLVVHINAMQSVINHDFCHYHAALLQCFNGEFLVYERAGLAGKGPEHFLSAVLFWFAIESTLYNCIFP